MISTLAATLAAAEDTGSVVALVGCVPLFVIGLFVFQLWDSNRGDRR
ncbi:hypothetical protein O7626_41100 [Micromonospora sp. WMMD1102]|nr:hypothetical protein [Micromonospora sp. WMMD1102]MDG4784385.1 hypothetical protein [Micromonospora sp. WMMD1102]MDG4791889.1 hypothetical protein [Micromonospora sp. WMMD1102]MDG4792203.1 hypothetical protein [Micromonospora sp. WMMD1102]